MIKYLFPQSWQEFLPYISQDSLKVIEWKSALSSVMKSGFIKGETHQRIIKSLTEILIDPIKIVDDVSDLKLAELSEDQKTALAHRLLSLYFCQFFNNAGQIIDLRLKHFNINDSMQLCWKPPAANIRFDQVFRINMIGLYRGFYENDQELLVQSMNELGLIKSEFTDAQRTEILNLLRDHFAPADQGEMFFKLSHFKESFHKLFEFLMKYQCQLPGDFLFLGIYLVGLYQSLERLGVPLRVESVWKNVEQRGKTPHCHNH